MVSSGRDRTDNIITCIIIAKSINSMKDAFVTALVVGYALLCLTALVATGGYSVYSLHKLNQNTKILGCAQCALNNGKTELQSWYKNTTGKDWPTGPCKDQCSF